MCVTCFLVNQTSRFVLRTGPYINDSSEMIETSHQDSETSGTKLSPITHIRAVIMFLSTDYRNGTW